MPDAAQPVMEDPKGERCPRCLQNVSAGASRCPNCGQPIHSIRSLLVAIGIAGLLVLVFVMLVMYKVMANEDAASAPVPVDDADQKQQLFRDPPPASSANEPAKPDRPTKPEKKPPLDEH
jgi:hypothetical protein